MVHLPPNIGRIGIDTVDGFDSDQGMPILSWGLPLLRQAMNGEFFTGVLASLHGLYGRATCEAQTPSITTQGHKVMAMNTWIQKSLVLALSAAMLAGTVQAQPRGDDRGPQGRPDQRSDQRPDQRFDQPQNQARPGGPQGNHAGQPHRAEPLRAAEPQRPNAQHPAQGPQHHAQPAQRLAPPAHAHGNGQPHDRFERGQRLGQQYRSNQYVVDNWRSHNLRAPDRGQQWVMVGGDYLLITAATGIIVSVLLNH